MTTAEREPYNRSLKCWRDNCRVTHVHDDWSVAKPREKCLSFTFTLYSPDVAAPTPWGVRDMERRIRIAGETRDKVAKKIERELNRKRRPKVDNVAAFLKIRFPRLRFYA